MYNYNLKIRVTKNESGKSGIEVLVGEIKPAETKEDANLEDFVPSMRRCLIESLKNIESYAEDISKKTDEEKYLFVYGLLERYISSFSDFLPTGSEIEVRINKAYNKNEKK